MSGELYDGQGDAYDLEVYFFLEGDEMGGEEEDMGEEWNKRR